MVLTRQSNFSTLLRRRLFNLARKRWWLSFLVWIALVGPAQAAVEMRVAIKQNVNRVEVGSSTQAIVRNQAGEKIGEIAGMNSFHATPSNGGVSLSNWQGQQLWIEPVDGGYVWIDDRWYRGKTQLVRTEGGLLAINHVNLEQYLYSVVGSEMVPSWPLEALKAQAVTARSYALYKRSRSANPLYDLGDTTVHQVYKGVQSETNTTQAAVRSTANQVLIHNNNIILAVYHAASGGHTENVEDVWMEPLPYLRGVPDFDQGTPSFQWSESFRSEDLGRRLEVGNVLAMIPTRLTPRGRVEEIQIQGTNGSRTMDGERFRQALNLKSTLFTIAAVPNGFQINGRGFGHGIGMSQWGSLNLAYRGASYQQILAHYYQNTALALVQPQP